MFLKKEEFRKLLYLFWLNNAKNLNFTNNSNAIDDHLTDVTGSFS